VNRFTQHDAGGDLSGDGCRFPAGSSAHEYFSLQIGISEDVFLKSFFVVAMDQKACIVLDE
jgi:hypothetical protein